VLSVVDDARLEAQDGHAAWSEAFNELFAQVAGVFENAAVRRHGRWYLLSRQERKNSWWLAEFAGDVSPVGMQRLLTSSPRDEVAARDALARHVARRMGDPAAVLAVDETGFLKKGRMSAGVAACVPARPGGWRTARSACSPERPGDEVYGGKTRDSATSWKGTACCR
jgi:hypothetical protein